MIIQNGRKVETYDLKNKRGAKDGLLFLSPVNGGDIQITKTCEDYEFKEVLEEKVVTPPLDLSFVENDKVKRLLDILLN